MRPKIRYDLLVRSQNFAKLIHHPIQFSLYQAAYKYIEDLKSHVVKPFTNICIHGNYPELFIPSLQQKQKANYKIWTHSHLTNPQFSEFKVQTINPSQPFNTSPIGQNYDLIISCLEAHHYDTNKLMQNYVKRLNPDGAVIGCCFAQNTLKQLRWAYMMAENQRSGGMSPKVSAFPGLGEIGHAMTTAQLKLSTIMVRDYLVEVESAVDILTLLQAMGESGTLQGKRKGVYKDVLLAACALYDQQFRTSKESQSQQKLVNFSMQLGLFIGWKEHESQPKPLNRKQLVNKSFFVEVMKSDSEAKAYVIDQGSEVPREVKVEQIQLGQQNQEDPKK